MKLFTYNFSCFFLAQGEVGDSRCDLRGHPWTGPGPPGEGLPPVLEVR